jgi:hypothetical protein
MFDESFLVGTLVIRATRRGDHAPLGGVRVHIDASCTGCCCGTWVQTDARGMATAEVPIGKVRVTLDGEHRETWIALDRESIVEFAR